MVCSSTLTFFLLFGVLQEAFGVPAQAPLELQEVTKPHPRKLKGRFLHVTDMHPDPYYRPGKSEATACHRNKPKKKPRSGPFGMPYSDCDSPLSLTNYTLDYLEEEWVSEIDFVIWTGDSARHDNDRKLPRTLKEIYSLNRAMTGRMEQIFTARGIPVVPSIGNNDVWPHNIMMPGPNDVTFEFSSIWKSFVPFHSFQVFQRGGYYSVEVIPDAVAVLSLNTMYFFDSNKAVGGCESTDSEDPGNLQLDWMSVQLSQFRSRGMQVWLSGHVPPSAKNYHPECHVRYVELSLRYQDTILGHLFGHMNADHFFFLDAQELGKRSDDSSHNVSSGVEPFGKHKDLYKSLLKDFQQMAKTQKKSDYDNLAVVNVAPSVVPNPYLPSFRIFSYNISGTPFTPDGLEREAVSGSAERHLNHHLGDYVDRESNCAEPRADESWLCKLSEKWHSDPGSPSRTNTLWSPLGFAQYYLPDLNETKKGNPPKWKLEYMTFEPQSLHPSSTAYVDEAFVYPIPLQHLPRSLRNATKTKSKYAPYRMADLTIPSWTELARRLAKSKHEKLRKRFRKYMYMGAGEEL